MRRKTNHKEIFDTLPESIIIVDKNFTVLEMNDYAEGTFRISREKAYGRHSSTFMPKELEEVALMAMEESRTIFGDEINPSLRGGERIAIQPVATPLFALTGELKGVIIQIKDLSGSKFLSSKNTQEISAFKFEHLILGLAHELKNPLSGIRGAAQLLAEDSDNRETTKCAELIIREADRLKELLDTLKQLEPFAKDIFVPVDIHELLMEIIYLESMPRSREGVEIRQNYDVTLPPILGDRNSLKQVFLNLIKNAYEAVGNKGRIEISTKWMTEHLKGQKTMSVEIRDSGAGIEKHIAEKIFSPFYTTKKEGSGLGLFLAYQIIAKHGGAIIVDSQPGEGAAFKVFLPISGY
ncbi:MAG: nitrogen regulation protein NR(II) [Candidatus Dadabacteria bacterium]